MIIFLIVYVQTIKPSYKKKTQNNKILSIIDQRTNAVKTLFQYLYGSNNYTRTE